jgi:DNA-binding MarR family transcriptional regulator
VRPLSRGAPERRETLLGGLVREVRQFNGLGASFFRAVAGRVGMNAADVQVVDILAVTGPTTAGRLAALTGLTTGAIAQMLDRLEEAGLVRRGRDPDDGRRVIVRLAPGEGAMRELAPVFDSVERAWKELASRYDDEQLALLLAFLERGNAVSREEIAQLREAPAGGTGGAFSAPLGNLGSGRLVVASGATRLALRADAGMAELYRASFEGAAPDVKAEGGTVTIRYPRRLGLFKLHQQAAEVALSTAVPWQIVVRGGASEVVADLVGLDLAGLEIEGGASQVRLNLPEPSGTVRVRIAAGASDVTIRRPPGVAARVRVKGWASALTFDDQTFGDMVTDVRLQSPGYEDAPRRYDIEVSGSASQFTLIAG